MRGAVRASVGCAMAIAACVLHASARTATADCAAPMSDAITSYATTRLRILTACELRRARGAGIANCRPADGRVTDARTRARLRVAGRRLRRDLDQACSVLPARVGPPCADVRSNARLAACVVHPPVNDVH